jgi:fructose-1,6-bisphosphatase
MVVNVRRRLTCGKRRIMDVQPTQWRERLSDFMGSKNEANRASS